MWLNWTLKAIAKEMCSEHRMGHNFSGGTFQWHLAEVCNFLHRC